MESIYEPRPCKGLISRQMLRGKPRPRYAPLTGAAARIDELRREIGASPYPGICAPFRGNPPQLPCYLAQNRTETFLDFEHPTSDGVITNDTIFVGGGWGASTVAHFACKVRATDTSREGLGSLWVRNNLRPPHFASKVSYNASPQSYSVSPQNK